MDIFTAFFRKIEFYFFDYTGQIPKNFDWLFYIDKYPDLKRAGIDSEEKAKNHYMNFGKNEQRQYCKEKTNTTTVELISSPVVVTSPPQPLEIGLVENEALSISNNRIADVINLKEYVTSFKENTHSKRQTILICGHDFKFFTQIIDLLRNEYDIIIDKWSGHSEHNEFESSKKIKNADIIICEWGLGNAVWYSKHKENFQRLVIRVHRQEIETSFLEQVEWENVDKIIFISPYIQQLCSKKNEGIAPKSIYIPNYVNINNTFTKKDPNSVYNIGILGYTPKSKRLDLALEILENLIKQDTRYKLFIKGKSPNQLPWLQKRSDEMLFFESIFNYIETKNLKQYIVWEDYGEDVETWFKNIGFILSVSDVEGSHQAVAEGMATGAIPIITGGFYNEYHADLIYPEKYCFSNIESAVKRILYYANNSSIYEIESNRVSNFSRNHFDLNRIYTQFNETIKFKADVKERRLLVYADVNLNIIDGSTIWLTSLINMLNSGDIFTLDLLLKTSISNETCLSNITKSNKINIIDPFDNYILTDFTSEKELTAKDAVDCIKKLDYLYKYETIVIRGSALISHINHSNVLDKTIFYSLSSVDNATIEVINRSKALAIQTPQLQQSLIKAGVLADKTFLLPPMVKDFENEKISFERNGYNLVYSGKFSKGYNAIKIIKTFKEQLGKYPDFRLHLIIAKIFNADGEEYVSELKKLIYNNKDSRIKIYHNLSREEVFKIIRNCDIGISWRDEQYDDSLEISTKLLEYSSLGLPIILNRNLINESFFGVDYPLYANTESEYVQQIINAFENKDIYYSAAKTAFEKCEPYRISNIFDRIKHKFSLNIEEPQVKIKKSKILFACENVIHSDKWKFIDPIIDELRNTEKYVIRYDEWNYYKPSEKEIDEFSLKYKKKNLEWADVIFCEWCNYNAIWYSKNKKAHQKLIIRLHRYEAYRLFPAFVNWKNVDSLIVITKYFEENFSKIFLQDNTQYSKLPTEQKQIFSKNILEANRKITYIGNITNYKDFVMGQAKNEDFQYHIGLLGWNVNRKRVDRAISLLIELKKINPKYKLYLKGFMPNLNEEYYKYIFDIMNSPTLKDSVFIENYGNSSFWMKNIGFILSMSESEGSHQAVIEGIFGGCLPIIINWEGASHHYESNYVFENITQMVDCINKHSNDLELFRNESIRLIKKYKPHFDKEYVILDFIKLLDKENSI